MCMQITRFNCGNTHRKCSGYSKTSWVIGCFSYLFNKFAARFFIQLLKILCGSLSSFLSTKITVRCILIPVKHTSVTPYRFILNHKFNCLHRQIWTVIFHTDFHSQIVCSFIKGCQLCSFLIKNLQKIYVRRDKHMQIHFSLGQALVFWVGRVSGSTHSTHPKHTESLSQARQMYFYIHLIEMSDYIYAQSPYFNEDSNSDCERTWAPFYI